MEVHQIIVTFAGMAIIAFIYWFFFMKREAAVTASKSVNIVVNGGYVPEAVKMNAGEELTLNFLRKDPSPCLEEIVFSDFGIRRYLPLNENVSITIKPQAKGSFTFACGMNMYHGKVIAS